ncbi:DBH-like monooxygenase protein 2 homolog [Porites lutea]|uniref:DBH-like monooxygenase protein 2 homolog n=1 Tax=Porites lutea TaxID=51062 RepID=UPI003CC5357F
MHFLSQIFAVFALAVLSFAACASNVLNYYTFDSGDENFTLQWAYDGDEKLIFNVSCKTTGWCAVGFTSFADGRNMTDYDMAVGGITANKTYLWGYHGLRPGVPYIDPTPDYVLISASESNGYTNLQFERETTTEEDDDPHDVQYRDDTEVWIVWAWRDDDADNKLNLDLKHTYRRVSSRKYNLIKLAGSTSSQAGSSGALVYAFLALVTCALYM